MSALNANPAKYFLQYGLVISNGVWLEYSNTQRRDDFSPYIQSLDLYSKYCRFRGCILLRFVMTITYTGYLNTSGNIYLFT